MAMKKFKYVDIKTLYEWLEFKVYPLITFPCNWKTYIEYIQGSSGFVGLAIPKQYTVYHILVPGDMSVPVPQ